MKPKTLAVPRWSLSSGGTWYNWGLLNVGGTSDYQKPPSEL